MPDLGDHYSRIVRGLTNGKIIPFLGAGLNLTDRPPDAAFQETSSAWLPSGMELALYLARTHHFPENEGRELARVSQFVALKDGRGDLYDSLHRVFDKDYPLTNPHRLLALIPKVIRDKGYTAELPIFITTNYDDLLEIAFKEAGLEFDTVIYMAVDPHRGRFAHVKPNGSTVIIDKPNEYTDFRLTDRPVLLKIHGTVDRKLPGVDGDSFVVTEDDYIDYLTRTDISNLLPTTLLAKMRQSHFLFLGYGLRDWNLRVILHRIWGEQRLERTSWAIQHPTDPIDAEFWRKRNVEVIDIALAEYTQGFSAALTGVPKAAGI